MKKLMFVLSFASFGFLAIPNTASAASSNLAITASVEAPNFIKVEDRCYIVRTDDAGNVTFIREIKC